MHLELIPGDFIVRRFSSGVPDVDQTFAHLLDADAGAPGGNTDLDVGKCAHDPLSRLFHYGNMSRTPRDLQGPFLPSKGFQFARNTVSG
ncbi:MAG: hypothetical protein A4E69_02367 [Syntrophus sp. PtaB.Bin138]|nr:MAG: hypothetical protein A4E69_02367 [Syntrophus sp. PtaB.Bin138]